MTKLLSEAFEKASELPENLQDELARELLDELAESETRPRCVSDFSVALPPAACL
jgi:hypothetical protein